MTTEENDCHLELSISFSSFEENDEEIESDDQSVHNYANIAPYQFEPFEENIDNSTYLTSSDSENSDHDDEMENHRLLINDWCTCSNCEIMPTLPECTCCREIERVAEIMNEYDPNLGCIVDHPGFHSVCLDGYVLQTAYYAYRQQYGERQETENQRQRYTAYRQLVRWCWGYLGRDIRVPLPSCGVNRIRRQFPSDEYKGFQLHS